MLTAGAWPLNQKEDAKATEASGIQIPAEVNVWIRVDNR